MVEESILIEKSAKETTSLAKKTINQIFGKVVKEESRRIYWEYEIGVHIVNCETSLEPQPYKTVITTSAHSKTRKSSSKPVLDKFHSLLLENLENKNPKISPSVADKKRKLKRSGGNSGIKSFPFKHLIIGSIIIILAISFFTDSQDNKQYFTKEGYYGTYTEDDLNMLLGLIANEDDVAINTMYRNGRIIFIPANRKAYIVKSKFTGSVKIRIEGNTTEFWTVTKAITK